MTFEELVAGALEKVQRQAQQSPLYQKMLQLQSQMGIAPNVSAAPMPVGRYGEYRYMDTGGSSLKLNQEILARNPAFAEGTLMHEMAHGSRNALGLLATRSDTSPQFKDAWKKLEDTQATAKAIAPEWAGKYSGYRGSREELPAFAVGEHYRQGADEAAPPHIDATLASEMEILLELAEREFKKKGKSK